MNTWDAAMEKSFQIVKPSKNVRRGVNAEVRKLLNKESQIRKSVLDCAEKGRRIADIQKLISEKNIRKYTSRD